MFELNYQPSRQSSWPIKAAGQGFELSFSGSLTPQRVKQEQTHHLLNLAIKTILWLVLALGLLSLGFSAWLGFLSKNWLFFLSPGAFNLAFWVSTFTTAYLWTKLKQETLQEEALNLLHWEDWGKNHKAETLDIYELFNKDARQVWNNTLAVAKNRQKTLARPAAATGEVLVTATDLFVSLLKHDSIKLVFWRMGANAEDLETIVKNYGILSPKTGSEELAQLPFIAFTESLKLHNKTIDPLMLLCALGLILPPEHIIQSIFYNINLSLEKLETISSWIFNLKLLREDLRMFKKLARLKPEKEINKGLTSVPTFYLDHYSTDFTWLAKHGALPLAWGRAGDLRELFALLSLDKKNLIIKGAEGTGRTTLINELAYRMVTEQAPRILQDKRLVKLEIPAILGNPQKAENTFIHALTEAEKAGNIIIVVEDLHALSHAQTSSGLSLLELLVNFLQDHNLMVIGTTTVSDYSNYLQNAPSFEETFASYELSELSHEGVMLACCIKASILESRGQCFFRYPAIEKAVELSDAYIKGAGQPQKTINILVEASSRIKNSPAKVITEELIDKIVSDKTHIPTQALDQNEAEKLLHLEEELSRYIIGQAPAISAVAEGLRRSRSGLSSAARPLASFLFLGPTGVGKTEIAKTLAKVYFDGTRDLEGKPGDSNAEKYMFRLDMSEYRGPDGLAKLLGSETGKLDSPLIRHLKNYPFCLLLVDEFEKASPEIINLFLQILEDGRLTSGKGELIDLTHALIIATSNAGTVEIQNGLNANKTLEQIKTELFNRTLLKIYPPELLNRFDAIVLFSPLSPLEVEKIAWLQLEQLRDKLESKGIKISFTDQVIKDIAKNAFDPLLGARPVRRYIQDHVEGFIAKILLSKQAPRGTELTVDIKDGKLVLK
jgi:ATP-dependent Clp protease ATP-binding subunit ClpC